MVIRALCFLILIGLIGCNSSREKDVLSPITTEELKPQGCTINCDQTTGPTSKIKWNDKPCQRTVTCENVVFNLSNHVWNNIFDKMEAGMSKTLPDEEKVIQCGSDFFRSAKSVSNMFLDITDQDRVDIVNFVDYVFDIKNCMLKPSLFDKMNEYINL